LSNSDLSTVLSKYVPPDTIKICVSWIVQKNIHLKITRDRSSKYGDYIPLQQGGHRISVNHNLNQYSFLITFIHEVAHLETYLKYKRRHEPHGKEWKHEFRILLKEFIDRNIFPEDIKKALVNYIHNPSASSCTDYHLHKALKAYDRPDEGRFHLEDLPENSLFTMYKSTSKLRFKKGQKLRTRFQCLEVTTNRIYFVSPMAEVIPYNS